MSEPSIRISESDFIQLSEAALDLSESAARFARVLERLSSSRRWDVVPYPVPQSWIKENDKLKLFLRFRGVEDGPPETPRFLLNFGDYLSHLPSEEDRDLVVRPIFVAGFWAKASLDCSVPQPDPMANGGPPKKAPARRVTTAALQDRVEALSAQVQLLLGQNAPKAPATPVAAASHVVEIRASNSKTVRCTESKYWRRRPCEGSCPSVSASSSEVWCSQSIPCCSQAWTCYVRGRALHFLRSASGNMLMALSQQSSALTALVAHLTAGGGDPLLDFGSSSSSSSSTSTRGLLRREKLIADLSAGSSTFFLQFQQQLFRKMNPSMVAPKTEEDIQRTHLP